VLLDICHFKRLGQCVRACLMSLPASGQRAVDPERCRFMPAGAYGNGQSIERRAQKGGASPTTRCDPGQVRICSPRLEHVDEPLTADDIDPLPLVIEEDIVDVPTGVPFGNKGSIRAVEYTELWRSSKDDNQVATLVVERHGEVSSPPIADGPDLRLLRRVEGNDRDRLRVGKIDEDLPRAAANLEAFRMAREGNVLALAGADRVNDSQRTRAIAHINQRRLATDTNVVSTRAEL